MAYSKLKHVEAAQKQLGAGRVANAIAEYQLILKREPNDQVTLMTIGDLYVRQGETFQAIEYFERLAQIFVRDGFLAKAIAIYKKVAKLAPEETKPLEKLADLYVQSGILSEARPLFLQLAEAHLKAGRREPAAALLRKLLEAEPDNLRVQMRLAEVQLAMGQKQDAAHTLLTCAERQLEHRDPEEALKLVNRALELAPESVPGRMMKARALAASGKHAEAATLLESLPEIETGNEAAEHLLDLYLQEEKTGNALELAARVLSHSQDNKRTALARKAVNAMLEGEHIAATLPLLDSLRQAMSAQGETEALAQLLQAVAAKLSGRIEPLEWLVELYTVANDSFHLPEALNQLGQAAAAAGHFDRAQQIYEQLLEKSPEDKNLRRNLEQVRSRLGLQPLAVVEESRPPMEEEQEAPAVYEEPALDEETQQFVTVSLTDVDLFSSYGLNPKAIELLEQILERAPRYTPAIEKLLDLYLGAGENKRTAELAELLAQIYTERGDMARADRFDELQRRFQRAAALEPEPPPAPATPTEFALPLPEADSEGELIAPGEMEQPEEVAAGAVQDSVHEVDLSDEWASISEQLGGTSAQTDGISEAESEAEAESEPTGVEANTASFSMEEEPAEKVPELIGSAVSSTAEPQEYELELVEQAAPAMSAASVSPIRSLSSAEEKPLDDLAQELGLSLEGFTPIAPTAPSNGGARLNAPVDAAPATAAPAPPYVQSEGASDPGGPLSEIFNEFREELDELKMDEDPETHYNLGIAYREMGLLEEAISEFQKVVQAHDHGKPFKYTMQCCTLLALAFMEKGQPEIACYWYDRALQTPGLDQESILALRYDLGVSQELAGQADTALKSFQQVYAVNIDYRDVSDRILSLRQR
jgi:tetratricopeptide (TPR) repeat protein